MADEIIHEVVPSPNPSELGLTIEVPQSVLAQDPVGRMPLAASPTQAATRYRDERMKWLATGAYLKGFGDYVYTYSTKDRPGWLTLHFAKSKTTEERNTPFKTFYVTRNGIDWPTIFYGIMFFRDSEHPLSFNKNGTITNADRIIPKPIIQKAYVGPTICKVEQYLSEEPWNNQALKARRPIPDDVIILFLGVKIEVFRCIHPEFRIRNPNASTTSLFYKTGIVPRFGFSSNEQLYPATNMVDWQPYVFDDVASPVQGQWLRERVTAYPPQIRNAALR